MLKSNLFANKLDSLNKWNRSDVNINSQKGLDNNFNESGIIAMLKPKVELN